MLHQSQTLVCGKKLILQHKTSEMTALVSLLSRFIGLEIEVVKVDSDSDWSSLTEEVARDDFEESDFEESDEEGFTEEPFTCPVMPPESPVAKPIDAYEYPTTVLASPMARALAAHHPV